MKMKGKAAIIVYTCNIQTVCKLWGACSIILLLVLKRRLSLKGPARTPQKFKQNNSINKYFCCKGQSINNYATEE